MVRRKRLYPTTPEWWEQVEVARGVAARVPQNVARQGRHRMGELLGGPYHLMLAAFWAVDAADVFLRSIHYYGHLWRLPLAIQSVLEALTTECLCSAGPSAQPFSAAGLELLRLVEAREKASWRQ